MVVQCIYVAAHSLQPNTAVQYLGLFQKKRVHLFAYWKLEHEITNYISNSFLELTYFYSQFV